jgi:hypothetical protein
MYEYIHGSDLPPRALPTIYWDNHPASFSGTADMNFSWRQARGSGVRASQSVGSRTLKGYPPTCRSLFESLSAPVRSRKALPAIECVSVSWPSGKLAHWRLSSSVFHSRPQAGGRWRSIYPTVSQVHLQNTGIGRHATLNPLAVFRVGRECF